MSGLKRAAGLREEVYQSVWDFGFSAMFHPLKGCDGVVDWTYVSGGQVWEDGKHVEKVVLFNWERECAKIPCCV